MKKLIAVFAVFIVALAVAVQMDRAQFQEKMAQKQAQIDARTVVAYQVADDGAMQITFANGEGFYFENKWELLDQFKNIENTGFLTELEECYDGHDNMTKIGILTLNQEMLLKSLGL